MAGQLSVLVEMFKKQQGANRQPGKPGVRTSAQQPALPGQTRGAMGALGSKLMQNRNSQAGAQKEMKELNSPIFAAFLQRMSPGTPMADTLRNTNGY